MVVIYDNGKKRLELRRSMQTNAYCFYIIREDKTYKLKEFSQVIGHIVRNLSGISRLRALGRAITFITLIKLSLD